MLRTSHYHTTLLVACLALSGCSDKKAPLSPSAAANTAATQPSQTPTPIEEPLEEATLMRAAFGADYDAKTEQAITNLLDPDEPSSHYTGVVTAVAHTTLPDGETLLLTNARALNDEPPSHASMGSLSLYVLRKQDGKWKIIKRNENFDALGAYGDAGTADWVQLGNGKAGLTMTPHDFWLGSPQEWLVLYDVSHSNVRRLIKEGVQVQSGNMGDCLPHKACWNVTGKWKLVAAPSGVDYNDLVIDFTGEEMDPVEGATEETDWDVARTAKPIKTQARYRFDGTTYKLIEGKNPA